ncbi:MAG: hypothetical protein KDD82_02630 [Planctomycetes bacterium]|nr:hypothetical protein [Planctomycetota bacterium]
MTASASEPASASPPRWADRGWYLAAEYGVLAKDRFLTRLPKLRKLGRFQELLDPEGSILYRNLFREEQIEAAWELLTVLRPWHDQLTCYLCGDEVPVKLVHDVLWCAGFLAKERPCRGVDEKTPSIGCDGARILLAPTRWDACGDAQRHAFTFARVDARGKLVFDREAIAAFVAQGEKNRFCPISPARDPARMAQCFGEVDVRELGWTLSAELAPSLVKTLGTALTDEHGFVLKKGLGELERHAVIELRELKRGTSIRLADADAKPSGELAQQLRIPAAVQKVLASGSRLRATRVGEDYVRLKGGHYEVEQRFVIQRRVKLEPGQRAQDFALGYTLSTTPRKTPEYEAWAKQLAESLP